MKKFLPTFRAAALTLGITLAASLTAPAAVVYDGSPYTAWKSDYTGSEAHTLALWKFNNPDQSASSGGTSIAATFSGTGVVTGFAGKFGQAFRSETRSTASDSYAQAAGSSGIFNGSSLSIEFWYSPVNDRPAGTSSYSWFFDKSTSNSGVQLRLATINGGTDRLMFTVGNGTSTANASSGDLTWSADQWYHIAVTYETVQVFEGDTLVRTDGLLKIFRDGVQLSAKTEEGFGNLAAGTRNWRIGNRATSTYGSVPGSYDNFRISDVAYNYSAIPEPSTFALLGAMAPLAWVIRRSALRSK